MTQRALLTSIQIDDLINTGAFLDDLKAAVLAIPLRRKSEVFILPIECIYFCHDRQSDLQYIGKTRNLQNRWRNHKYKSMVETGQWTIRTKKLNAAVFNTLEIEEAFYIAAFRPPCNMVIKCEVH